MTPFQLKYPPAVHGNIAHTAVTFCGVCEDATYRIESWGDGAGVETVKGWAAVVENVTNQMFSPATDADRESVLDMLLNGCDGEEGWNGTEVYLQFEDGGILVEQLPYTPKPSPRPNANEPSTDGCND